MFFVKVLGFLDIFGAILLLFVPSAPIRIVLGQGLYLIMKGKIYQGDFLSFIDMIIGIYFCLSVLISITFISVIAGIYLLLKGIWSFMN